MGLEGILDVSLFCYYHHLAVVGLETTYLLPLTVVLLVPEALWVPPGEHSDLLGDKRFIQFGP